MNTATQILLVDDEVAIVQVLSEMLRLEGYEVWEATTGQQALQLAR